MKLVIIMICLLCFLICRAAPPPPLQPQQPTDFFILAVEWPIGYCAYMRGRCKADPRELPTEFSLHGLWPNENAPKTGGEFSYRKIESLRGKLRRYFFSLDVPYKPEAEGEIPQQYKTLWKNEWDKHGKKSGLDQKKYFETSLWLLDNVKQVYSNKLRKNYPPGSLINLDQLAAAFDDQERHMKPNFVCHRDAAKKKTFIIELKFNITGNFQFTSAVSGTDEYCDSSRMAYLLTAGS